MEKFFTSGQTVYHININISHQVLIGAVVCTDYSGSYPIRVKFNAIELTFTAEGCLNVWDNYVTLFQISPILTIVENKPMITFEDGELVLVRDSDDGYWVQKYYYKFNGNSHHCYMGQERRGATTTWNQVIKYESNPLLPILKP